MNKLVTKSSILSISLLTVMASAAVSPALGKIKLAFGNADITLIKLVLTMPSLLIIPFSLIGGWLASRMKKKHLLLIGLIIYFLGGVGGGFARNITELLIIRAFFGIGAGLIIPLSTSLIADFYEGIERAKMMGYSGSTSHFGGVIFLLVSGWLASISWRYAFAVYGLALVIILMVLFWLPEPESKKAAGQNKFALPSGIYILAVLGALMMIAFYAAPTNLAMFTEKMGKPGIAGYLLSAMTLVGVGSGIILALLMRLLRSFCATVAITSMAAGYWILGVTNSLSGVVIAVLCIGFSSGVLMPLLLLEVARLSPGPARAFAMAVLSVGVYLGQFVSPIVLKWAGLFSSNADVFRQQFNVLAIGLACATCVSLGIAIKNKNQPVMAGAIPGHH
jgi:MFS family permease